MAKRAPEDDLAASLHEATNAMTVVVGWIERAQQADDDATRQVALARAAGYARRARDGMRHAIGGDTPEPGPEAAVEVARRVLDDLALEAQREAVQLGMEGGSEAWLSAPHRVWQILTNLTLNAIAMTPPSRAVRLSCHTEDDMVVFDVRDEGPGVPEHLRADLFAGGRSERPGGTGIGLRHAHELAKRHGGALALIDHDGEGAQFQLRWPTTAPIPSRTPPPSQPSPATARLEGARVLILEDDDAVVELLELSLQAKGAAVTAVRDAAGLDAELDATQSGYDVLLVDLSPLTEQKGGVVTEDEGLDRALEKARHLNPGIGVVVISGSVTVAPRDDIVWVRKPFAPKEIVQAIAQQRKDRA